MVQSVIGALRVNLGLDSAQFEKGAKRTRSATDRLAQQMRRFATVAATAFAGLGAAALKGASDIDASAKAARRIGSSIGGFEALKLSASEAGVPISALPNELQNINRELANIGTSGNADRALERLGLSASDLAGIDADEKIARIADRVKELGLSSGEATALLRDLGVRNREMVLLLQGGGEAIRRARQDVEDYGLAIGGPAVAAVEQANDQIGRLTIVARVFGQELGFAIVPALGRFAEKVTESAREGGALRGAINGVAAVGRVLANVIDLVSENLDFLIDLFKVFVAAKIVVYVGAVGRSMIALGRAVRTTGLIMLAFTRITTAKVTAIGLLGAVVAKLTGTYDDLTSWIRDVGARLEAMLPESLRTGLDGLRESVDGLTGGLDDASRVAENDFFNAFLDAQDAATSFGEASRSASKGVEALSDSADRAAEASDRLSQTAGVGSSAFKDFAKSAVKDFSTIGDAGRRLADRLIDDILDRALEPMSNAFGDLFAGLFGGGGGLFGGGGRSSSGASIVPIPKNLTPSFDGGGYTGSASRTGGLDGKGGFMAMLHPREVVTDLTRGAGAGAGGVVRLMVGLTSDLDGRIVEVSGPVAAQVYQAGERDRQRREVRR